MDNSEMKVNSEESKRSGEGSFSLAKLWCFHWLGLLLGGKKISSSFSKVIAVTVWECKVRTSLLVGVCN